MDEQSLRNLLGSLDNEDLSEHGFVTCSNALIELDIRNVDLPEDLQILLQYKLTRYGAQYLAGPLESSTWSEAVDRVQNLFQRLQGQPSGDSFSVDDETLLLLKLIHNELWCLERVEQLQMIPVKEVAFCLALFLLVFKREGDFKVYRLVLNRGSVMEFLEAVVVVLQKVKVEGVPSPGDYQRFVCKKHRKVFKRLAKVYVILNRLYCMKIIQRDISAIIENDVDEAIRNTSMDRLLYKFKQHAELLKVPLDLRNHCIASPLT
ncbi:uncharacterized protein LOC6041774 [Culex quinquefasciatus]|uniref:uncharacterized protein LOC6041774 n=1 Tax=Culex quinquefasciatus TaxID=7176 RepID=UPI0018E3B053|nr:uncharacterized protein LOC6041774 [Culex quinquefasciatus]